MSVFTTSQDFHLCHLNIGPARGPLHSPVMAGFVAKLDEINNLAYQSPGFVWHLQIDINNPEHLAMYGEPGLLFNLSVWESVEDLQNYVYHSPHIQMMKQRREWFGAMDTPNYALWWKPAGELPTLEEAKLRIKALGEHGPTPFAFTFKQAFPKPQLAPAASVQYLHMPAVGVDTTVDEPAAASDLPDIRAS